MMFIMPIIFTLLMELNIVSISFSNDCEAYEVDDYRRAAICRVPSLTAIDLSFLDAQRLVSLAVSCFQSKIQPFPSGKFSHLRELRVLIVEDCDFNEIGSNAFRRLENLRYIRLSGKYNIEKRMIVDQNIFEPTPDLGEIILNMGIYKLPTRLFCNLRRLRSLNLARNYIQDLNRIGCGDKNHACCSRLESLDVDRNRITKIETNNLYFPILRNLTLSSNRIKYVERSAFDGLPQLRVLSLHGNELTGIREKLFQNNSDLKTLSLSSNRITYLSLDAFRNLKNLEYLGLSHNDLCFDETDVFNGLYDLKELYLSHNRIDDFTMPKSLSKLRYLSLSDNFLRGITDVDLPSLEALDLSNNRLTNISENAFRNLTLLSVLFLSNNRLERIPNLRMSNDLWLLNIDFNNITEIGPAGFLGIGKLKVLNLTNNGLTVLRNITFVNTPNIIRLYISDKLEFVEDGTFHVFEDLKNLTMSDTEISEMKTLFVRITVALNLRRNQIRVFKFTSIAPSLKILILDHNKLHTIKEPTSIDHYELLYFSARGNRMVTFSLYYFPRSITFILLTDNNISRIDGFTKVIYKNDLWVGLDNNSISEVSKVDFKYNTDTDIFNVFEGTLHKPIVYLRNNPIKCSCENSWLVNQIYYPSVTTDKHCKVTYSRIEKYFSYLKTENLRMDQLMCESEQCLPACRCFYNVDSTEYVLDCYNVTWGNELSLVISNNFMQAFFDGNGNVESVVSVLLLENLPQLRSLFLNNSGLTRMYPFRGLPNLMELHLEDNGISVIEREELQFFNLETLYLHGNELRSLSPDVFRNLTKLKILTLHENKLLQPRFWEMGLEHLSEITFAGNEFLCDCDLVPLQHWIFENRVIFKDLAETYCDETRLPIMKYNDSSCHEMIKHEMNLVVIITPTVVLIVFAIFLILLYFYRMEAKVILYSKFGWRLFHASGHSDEGKTYHAFISYANEDGEWIANELVPKLKHYNLCIHQRDFPVGEPISNSIINAVQNSARTVVFLTPSFLLSPWCMFEFDTAHLQQLEDKCQRVLVVILENVDNCEIDTNLNAYMTTHTYLDRNDVFFWSKLKYALPNLRVTRRANNMETTL